MPSGIQNWSKTPASNSNADSSINWAEGQAPSSVNDSARAVMARVAEWRDDLGGMTTGGTSTAYTITSNRVFTSLALMNTAIICIRPHTTSGANPTLSVDSLTAKSILTTSGTAPPTGSLVAFGYYLLLYDNTFGGPGAFILVGCVGPAAGLDIDGGTAYTAPLSADEAVIYSTAATANRKILLSNLWKVIDTFTAKTSPAVADEVALYDTSGAAIKKLALSDLFKVIDALTAKSPAAAADEVAIYDVAGTASKKITLTTLFASLDTLASKSSPTSSDEVAIYDVAGTTSKKATLAQLATALGGTKLVASTAASSGTTVSFTNIPACKMLQAFFQEMSHNSGSSQTLTLALSTNNGSSYNTALTNGFGAQAGASILHGSMTLGRLDQTSNFVGSGILGASPQGFVETTTSGTVNAIQFAWTGGASFDGTNGNITLYALS